MGIPALWDVIKGSCDERVTIDAFSASFLQQKGRPVRIAIDAYMFIFQSMINGDEDEENGFRTVTRNFVSKLMYLVALNITFVVVFDGKFKPNKLRNGQETVDPNYDSELQQFLETGVEEYSEGSEMISVLIKALNDHRIDYLQAPGEAEAQCAFLQRFGIVDYVLSSDVDTLVFGATNMLRNFSRFKEDIGVSPRKTATSAKFYVTPIRMSKVEQETGLNTNRLVFLASVGGGDYSKGLLRVGKTNAMRLALCGTPFAAFHTSPSKKSSTEPPPEFTAMLIRCFKKSPSKYKIQFWDMVVPNSQRKTMLDAFLSHLHQYIRDHSRDIFGRLLNVKESGIHFDEYYTLLYLFPLVDTSLYKFLPGTLSFGELEADSHDIKAQDEKELIERRNSNYKFIVGVSNISKGRCNFKPCEGVVTALDKLEVSSGYRGKAKCIIARLLTYPDDVVQITRTKTEGNITYLMTKYGTETIARMFPQISDTRTDPDDQSPSKLDYVWLPRDLMLYLNKQLVEAFDERERLKETGRASPRKRRYSPQKTTLENLGAIRFSPTKISSVNISPTPSPRSSTRKRPIQTGQNRIDRFFHKQCEEQNPFLDNKKSDNLLFVGSDDEFDDMKVSFLKMPQLSHSLPVEPKGSESPPKGTKTGEPENDEEDCSLIEISVSEYQKSPRKDASAKRKNSQS